MQSEVGIFRKLPQWSDSGSVDIISDRNILDIYINSQGDLMVEGDVISIDELGDRVKDFVDNNGDGTCSYCRGDGDASSSVNPKKAVISLSSNRSTSYATYVSAQNEIARAFRLLREEMARNEYGKALADLSAKQQDIIHHSYPMILSEAQVELGSQVTSEP